MSSNMPCIMCIMCRPIDMFCIQVSVCQVYWIIERRLIFCINKKSCNRSRDSDYIEQIDSSLRPTMVTINILSDWQTAVSIYILIITESEFIHDLWLTNLHSATGVAQSWYMFHSFSTCYLVIMVIWLCVFRLYVSWNIFPLTWSTWIKISPYKI